MTRTHAYVEEIRHRLARSHARQDVNRTSTFTNCPRNRGGIRPTASANYYRTPFGRGDDALAPWSPRTDAGRQSITTIVHDNLGQTASDLVVDRIGLAGVYFRPSIVGGDSYRVRAQLRLDAQGDYRLPNLEMLRGRYPLLPQAQSAGLRVWRKASIRAYISWSHEDSWSACEARFRELYEAAYVHFAYERRDPAVSHVPTDYLARSSTRWRPVEGPLVKCSSPGLTLSWASTPCFRRGHVSAPLLNLT